MREGLTRHDKMGRYVPQKRPDPVPRALGRGDITRLLDYVTVQEDTRDTTLVMLAYFGGRRVGEIARLRIEHLNLGEHPTWRIHGKGGKVKTLPMKRELAGYLRLELRDRGRTGWVIESHRSPGQGLDPKYVSRLLSEIMHKAGIDETGHALRHTMATELAREGADIRAVANLLLHADTSITEKVYTSAWDGGAAEALQLLGDPRHQRK